MGFLPSLGWGLRWLPEEGEGRRSPGGARLQLLCGCGERSLGSLTSLAFPAFAAVGPGLGSPGAFIPLNWDHPSVEGVP